MKKASLVLAAAVILVLVILAILSRFFFDLLWFDALGFRAVFTTVWLTEITVFIVATVVSAVMLAASGLLAAKNSSDGSPRRHRFRVVGRGGGGLPEVIEFSPDALPWRLIILAIASALGVFIGFAQSGNWDMILKWRYAAPFGRVDPLFGHDLGFYVFSLPVYGLIRDW